jgi:hypothetical protein
MNKVLQENFLAKWKKYFDVITAAMFVFPILIFSQTQSSQPKEPDVWAPFKYFVGKWQGQGEGKNGVSKGKQEYQFVLRGKFLQVKNEARFDPQEKNPKGELHEDMGLFSYDQARKFYVFRQFHVEGFVNQYICKKILDEGKTFIFVSEQLENLPPEFKARLTYNILNPNEFQMTFDLATPGKDFDCYSTGVLKRVK